MSWEIGGDEVSKLANVDSSAAVLWMLSFKHWANVSCFLCSGIVLCASMLEKLTKCLKFLASSLVHLGKGRCGSEKTAEKNVAGYIGTLWL